MGTFDSRLYRAIYPENSGGKGMTVVPYTGYDSFFYNYNETQEEAYDIFNEVSYSSDEGKFIREQKDNRVREINDAATKGYGKSMLAPFAMIHPYALIKLAGSYSFVGDGTDNLNMKTSWLTDDPARRRWYAIEGGEGDNGHYTKNPTTAALIQWGNEDPIGRTPYSYQDFVYCKHWNKIQNNRMITLRRFALPVSDNLNPEELTLPDPPKDKPSGTSQSTEKNSVEAIKESASTIAGTRDSKTFSPIATAITYFGEGTDNSLSDILRFNIGYKWEDASADVWNTHATEIDNGQVFGSNDMGIWLNKGLRALTMFSGIIDGDVGAATAGTGNWPPDPYSSGPYENRIVGPVNVINKVKKRNRELSWDQTGLKIKFHYVARPISNINTKAVILDILANMLLMTSGRGKFFGGAYYYRPPKPVVYPWKWHDLSNSIYAGKLFGKDSFQKKLFTPKNLERIGTVKNILGDIMDGIKNTANSIVSAITGKPGKDGKQATTGDIFSKDNWNFSDTTRNVWASTQRALCAYMLRGATVPWINNMKALLTGDPVGEWHLTIGNPLNPIAMIGNLVCTGCEIVFSDELGPDDFPIGFTATVSLEHGMGRDRDGAESMFNRGYGRIYSLPDSFKTAADGETHVDLETGDGAAEKGHVNAFSYVVPRQAKGVIEGSIKGNTMMAVNKLPNTSREYDGQAITQKTALNGDLLYLTRTPLTKEQQSIVQNFRVREFHTGFTM